jgi:hypothetical protein
MIDVFEIQIETYVKTFVEWQRFQYNDWIPRDPWLISESEERYFRVIRYIYRSGPNYVPVFEIEGSVSGKQNPNGHMGFLWKTIKRALSIEMVDIGNGWIVAKGKVKDYSGLKESLSELQGKISNIYNM